MQYRLTLTGTSGQAIAFDGTMGYIAHDVEGMGQPAASVATTGYAGFDGSYLGSSRIATRNIVIPYQFTAGISRMVGNLRWQLYSEFPVGQSVTVQVHTWHGDFTIDGVIESMEETRYEVPSGGQISIICADPWWKSTRTETVAMEEGSTGFTCTIQNPGIATPFTVKATRNVESTSVPSKWTFPNNSGFSLDVSACLYIRNHVGAVGSSDDDELTYMYFTGTGVSGASSDTETKIFSINNETHKIVMDTISVSSGKVTSSVNCDDQADNIPFLTLPPGKSYVFFRCNVGENGYSSVRYFVDATLTYTPRFWGI